MTTSTHSHKAWTDKGGHVMSSRQHRLAEGEAGNAVALPEPLAARNDDAAGGGTCCVDPPVPLDRLSGTGRASGRRSAG